MPACVAAEPRSAGAAPVTLLWSDSDSQPKTNRRDDGPVGARLRGRTGDPDGRARCAGLGCDACARDVAWPGVAWWRACFVQGATNTDSITKVLTSLSGVDDKVAGVENEVNGMGDDIDKVAANVQTNTQDVSVSACPGSACVANLAPGRHRRPAGAACGAALLCSAGPIPRPPA